MFLMLFGIFCLFFHLIAKNVYKEFSFYLGENENIQISNRQQFVMEGMFVMEKRLCVCFIF